MKKNWSDAQKHLAGGVNSPVRAFHAVGGSPVFMAKAKGPAIWDEEGKRYIDYCQSWGAIFWGHADPNTVMAIQKQASLGTSYGTATTLETELAFEIKKAFPNLEKIRFTSSGTEAVMSALRLARGVTGKNRILKFEGCYHGHTDSLLVKAGSGLATFGTPTSSGVPARLAELTTVLPYNDAEAASRFFKKNSDLACVIVEPIAGNMGVIPAKQEFLETLRKETNKKGALLIFDEVITGYRVAYGGAQQLYGIRPDITILGKIIGGGLPVGAFGASSEIMNRLSPLGNVYQAGTLSGNPLSMTAGLSVLRRLSPAIYRSLDRISEDFFKEARKIFQRKKMTITLQNAGSMFTFFFTPHSVQNFKESSLSDKKRFKRFFHQMLSKGFYFPPSAFETSFISMAHSQNDFQKTLRALATC